MNLENTEEEKKAIRKLELAFKKCSELGIKFSVMDSDLLYANNRLYQECLKEENKDAVKFGKYNGSYPTIAYAQDTELNDNPRVNCYSSMESCGGW